MNWNPKLTGREMYCLALGAFLGGMLVLPVSLSLSLHKERDGNIRAITTFQLPKKWVVSEVVGLLVTDPGMRVAQDTVVIVMPCGHVFRIEPGDKLPTRDIPCFCGSPRHWIFKRRNAEESTP